MFFWQQALLELLQHLKQSTSKKGSAPILEKRPSYQNSSSVLCGKETNNHIMYLFPHGMQKGF